MANRVLRDWTTSDAVDNLSPEAEVFFTRLIMKADDYGSYHANPKLIKSALFPLKDYTIKQIEIWLKELINSKIVFRYEVDGKEYIRIDNFGQRLRNMRNTFPQPVDNSLTTRGNSRPETKRNETETKQETETNAQTFDELFSEAFDENTCESYKLAFRGIDLGAELQKFRIKCDNDKSKYYGRDAGGLRTAFQYQLQNIRKSKNGTATTKQQHTNSIADTIRDKYGNVFNGGQV